MRFSSFLVKSSANIIIFIGNPTQESEKKSYFCPHHLNETDYETYMTAFVRQRE